MTPATLKDRRISSLLATTPLVAMAGRAGPEAAGSTRTGVRGALASAAREEQPLSPAPSASAAAAIAVAAIAVAARAVAARAGAAAESLERNRVMGFSLELRARRFRVRGR